MTIDISATYPCRAILRRQKTPRPPTFDKLSSFGKAVHSLHQELVRLHPQFLAVRNRKERGSDARDNNGIQPRLDDGSNLIHLLDPSLGWHLGDDVVNPITGELIPTKDCMAAKKLSRHLRISSKALTGVMEKHGLIDRINDYRLLPVMAGSKDKKPYYFTRPQATEMAIEEGFIIPVPRFFKGKRAAIVNLITPYGQRFLAEKVEAQRYAIQEARDTRPPSRKEQAQVVKSQITELFSTGKTAKEIVKAMSSEIPRSTAYHYIKEIRSMAA